MAVLADTHALVWYLSSSTELSQAAKEEMAAAEGERQLLVSAATFIDAWYVVESTGAIPAEFLDELARVVRRRGSGYRVAAIDDRVAREANSLGRVTLPDPWDRLIVATARLRSVPGSAGDDGPDAPEPASSVG